MRTELSDGTITILAYQPGIEQAVFVAADESLVEIGPVMRTWRDGATYNVAARHVAETTRAWQAGAWYDFAITRVGSSSFLGRMSLDQITADGTANVGYWVQTGGTRQGFATAAVRLLARFGFEDLGLQWLALRIAVDNPGSRRWRRRSELRLRAYCQLRAHVRENVRTCRMGSRWCTRELAGAQPRTSGRLPRSFSAR
jgi:RimJ/RimL family protein N-acetyltransferase